MASGRYALMSGEVFRRQDDDEVGRAREYFCRWASSCLAGTIRRRQRPRCSQRFHEALGRSRACACGDGRYRVPGCARRSQGLSTTEQAQGRTDAPHLASTPVPGADRVRYSQRRTGCRRWRSVRCTLCMSGSATRGPRFDARIDWHWPRRPSTPPLSMRARPRGWMRSLACARAASDGTWLRQLSPMAAGDLPALRCGLRPASRRGWLRSRQARRRGGRRSGVRGELWPDVDGILRRFRLRRSRLLDAAICRRLATRAGGTMR